MDYRITRLTLLSNKTQIMFWVTPSVPSGTVISSLTVDGDTFQFTTETISPNSGLVTIDRSGLLDEFFKKNGYVVDNLRFLEVNNMSFSSGAINHTEEWRSMSRTETIQRGTDTINVSYLLPSQSYTEQGRDGTELVEWEEKFVNGVSTGEKRNERRTTQISVVNNKRYVGTKTETPISPTQPEMTGAVIDFRNVNQMFYENNEIQSVYYMGEKLWEKIKEDVWELLKRVLSQSDTVTSKLSDYSKLRVVYSGRTWEGVIPSGGWSRLDTDFEGVYFSKVDNYLIFVRPSGMHGVFDIYGVKR